MGLFDKMFGSKKPEEPAKTNPPPAPAPADPGRAADQNLLAWLQSSEDEWRGAEAAAAPSSTSTETEVREALGAMLGFDTESSLAGAATFLVCASNRGRNGEMARFAVGRCVNCNRVQISIATVQPVCTECKFAIAQTNVLVSRDVIRWGKKFIRDHHQCVTILEEAQKEIADVSNAGGGQIDHKAFVEATMRWQHHLVRAVETAEAASVPAVAKEARRRLMSLNVLDRKNKLEQCIKMVESQPDQRDSLAAIADALFVIVQKQAYDAADGGLPEIAIQLLELVINHRAKLISLTPPSMDRLASQANDLDEVGKMIHQHQMARRPEGLKMVREAVSIMERLDREDPSGKAARADSLAAIRKNLALRW
jgi:hypothetical protein